MNLLVILLWDIHISFSSAFQLTLMSLRGLICIKHPIHFFVSLFSFCGSFLLSLTNALLCLTVSTCLVCPVFCFSLRVSGVSVCSIPTVKQNNNFKQESHVQENLDWFNILVLGWLILVFSVGDIQVMLKDNTHKRQYFIVGIANISQSVCFM